MSESFLVLFFKKELSFFGARPPRHSRAQALLFEKRSKNFLSGYR
jgi:hypothetical protein